VPGFSQALARQEPQQRIQELARVFDVQDVPASGNDHWWLCAADVVDGRVAEGDEVTQPRDRFGRREVAEQHWRLCYLFFFSLLANRYSRPPRRRSVLSSPYWFPGADY
jgi:hypothetical protein